eukprot:scaffold9984_cov106-Isochrysis_galbana.AAC.1
MLPAKRQQNRPNHLSSQAHAKRHAHAPADADGHHLTGRLHCRFQCMGAATPAALAVQDRRTSRRRAPLR